MASKDFEMDCPKWQKSIGSYCGCDISAPGHFDGFCRICDDELLSNPNKTVTFQSVNGAGEVTYYTRYCAWLEQDFNTNVDLDCARMQSQYSEACSCGFVIDKPTSAPTPSSSGERMYFNPWVLSGGYVMVWFALFAI